MEGAPWYSYSTLTITVLIGLSFFLYFYNIFWIRPSKLRNKLRGQGIEGPKPSFFLGNIPEIRRIQIEAKLNTKEEENSTARFDDDYCKTLFPHLIQWRKDYGPLFIYSAGLIEILNVSDPDWVREIVHGSPMVLGRPEFLRRSRKPIFGEGLLGSNGEVWAHERKIIAPEFFMDKIKGMISIISEAAKPLIEEWEGIIENAGGKSEITVDSHLRKFSADVISRVCFGKSYAKGEEIFSKLRLLQHVISKSNVFSTNLVARYLPTKINREIWRLDHEIRSLILNVVDERKQSKPTSTNKDLLQSVIEGANSIPAGSISAEDFIVDNCKNIYFAGHETTATTTGWCLLLLASHQEWQERVRAEVSEVCNGRVPDADMIRRLKTLNMVIQETIRLYPTAAILFRECLQDTKLKKTHIPKGTILQVTVTTLHRDPEMWGPDVDRFNPDRFANGISGACKSPHMYIPFGFGGRICAGQNLAMVELKIILSLLITRFSFFVSPDYVHSPAYRLTIGQANSLPLIVKKL